MAVAAVDDDQVARLHVPQNAAHARDGRDAAAPGEDRGVAGAAAGLGDDAADIEVAQAMACDGRISSATRITGPCSRLPSGDCWAERCDRHADDHVADVVQPLLEIFVVGAGEQGRVFVEQAGPEPAWAVRRSLTIQPRTLLVNSASRRIDFVDAKDARLLRAQLAARPCVAARAAPSPPCRGRSRNWPARR